MKNHLRTTTIFQCVLGFSLTIVGCSSEDAPGQTWQVTALAVEDLCNDPTVKFLETFDYRILFDGPAATLHIGDDAFAAGVLQGCDLQYETVVWSEQRDEGSLRWHLTGSASIYTGGDTCLLDGGKDWVGSEVVEVIFSDVPGIEAGCTYSMDLEGVYMGMAGE
jgi:hypothetical protein